MHTEPDLSNDDAPIGSAKGSEGWCRRTGRIDSIAERVLYHLDQLQLALGVWHHRRVVQLAVAAATDDVQLSQIEIPAVFESRGTRHKVGHQWAKGV